MKCDLCKQDTMHDIIAVFKTDELHVCKDCANALYVNRKILEVSIVEPMPKR